MVGVYCAVDGCWEPSGGYLSKHVFPNPEKDLQLFYKWVKICNNRRLEEEGMTPEKIYKNCRVCRKHFTDEDFTGKLLKRTVFPHISVPIQPNRHTEMEWSNEKIIEFLEMFQTERCLWDPRQKAHKDRGAQSDAWRRIVRALTFPVTVEDLKKKKDSLMGYYRLHLNKYKKSLKSGTRTSDAYTTNWFAFDIMHSFLKHIYEGNSTLNTEYASPLLENVIKSETSENQQTNCLHESQASCPSTPQPSTSQPRTLQQQSMSGQRRFVRNLPTEITETKKQMDETFNCIKSLSRQKERRDFDEYDHFASMIAAKIRKISASDEREILMNSIENLVFQSLMKNKNTNTSPSSSEYAHIHQKKKKLAQSEKN